jgi:hypothetical protein
MLLAALTIAPTAPFLLPVVVMTAGCAATLYGRTHRIPSGAKHAVCLRRAGALQILLGTIAFALTCAAAPTVLSLGYPPESGIPGWTETVVGVQGALFAWLGGFAGGTVAVGTSVEFKSRSRLEQW